MFEYFCLQNGELSIRNFRHVNKFFIPELKICSLLIILLTSCINCEKICSIKFLKAEKSETLKQNFLSIEFFYTEKHNFLPTTDSQYS